MKSLILLGLVLLVAVGCAPLINRIDRSAGGGGAANQGSAQVFLEQMEAKKMPNGFRGILNGEQVVADSVTSDRGCITTLITYQEIDHSETWTKCSNGSFQRAMSRSERLPAGSDFNAVRHAATQTAWRLGWARVFYADFEIVATVPDLQERPECTTIVNEVRRDGLLVDSRNDRICEGN